MLEPSAADVSYMNEKVANVDWPDRASLMVCVGYRWPKLMTAVVMDQQRLHNPENFKKALAELKVENKKKREARAQEVSKKLEAARKNRSKDIRGFTRGKNKNK